MDDQTNSGAGAPDLEKPLLGSDEEIAGEDKEESAGYLEATEEELEEERQDQAARLIQGLYRAKKARKLIRDLVLSNFVKEYDPYTGQFVYRNKRTNQTQWTKPIFLGDDDLPDPIIWKAPPGYAAKKAGVRQFALVVANTKYEHRRLPDLPGCLLRDQDVLRNVMINPYMGQFDVGDCTFLKDATLQAFKLAVDDIIDRAKQEEEPCTLFFFYSGYVSYIRKGPNKNTYFLFNDTNFRNQGFVARTGYSFTKFAKKLKKLKIQEKTIVLDVAHQKKRDEGFRTFGLYPPANLYQVLADACDAAVLGSCRLGLVDGLGPAVTMRQNVKKMAGKSEDMFDIFAGDPLDDIADGDFSNVKMFADLAADEEMSLVSSTSVLRAVNEQMPTFGVFAGLDPKDRALKRGLPALRGAAEKGLSLAIQTGAKAKKLASKVQTDRSLYWNIKNVPEILKEIEAFQKNQEELAKYLESEDDKEIRDLEEMIDKVQKQFGEYEEFGILMAEHSLFGARFIRAMRGEACVWNSSYERVTAKEVHKYLEEKMKADCQALDLIVHPPKPTKAQKKADLIKQAKIEDEKGEGKKTYLEKKKEEDRRRREAMLEKKRLPSAPPIEQCPVLALPISVHQRQEVDGVELCSKPCVPPFPYTPEVVEVKETMIALEWANPEYDGPENLKYEVQGRGKTRVNKNWKTLCTYATISQPFFKIPNLVPGVELMFRVRAFNYGGWGEYSWETDYIIPNPVARSISLARDLRAAAGFGARRVLAVMAARAHLAEVQRQGAKQLLAMAARYGGFKRISVAKECVEVVLKAMKKFDKDKVMQSLGCLVVGWSCKTGEEVINTALQNDAEKVLVDAQNTFKGDTAIINHSKWLYSVLQNTDNLSLSTGDESWMGAIGYY